MSRAETGKGMQSQFVRLAKGLANAPVLTLRETLFRVCVMSVGCTVWLARTWPGLIFGTSIFILSLSGGLMSQLRAERNGVVDQERRHEEEVRSKIARWPRRQRRAFLFFGVFVTVALLMRLVFNT
jgi:hypothetical protein